MSSTSNDQFAAIAREGVQSANYELVAATPVPMTTTYMLPSTSSAPVAAAPSYAEDLQRFNEQLAELRVKYKPFLANHVLPHEMQRKQQPLQQFQFRYHQKEDNRFSNVLLGEGEWEQLTVPDFRGPTKEAGKWTAYYRTSFTYGTVAPGKRIFLIFKGVDYKATVYVNDKCVGSHEGFFAPFSFDITDIVQSNNTLVVQVDNDYPTLGVNGSNLDGDKLYAATGMGWDDPIEGWHHCPPGGGIYQAVYIEERSELHVQDMFVRPLLEQDAVEVWLDVMNTRDQLMKNLTIELAIYPRNFMGQSYTGLTFSVEYAGPGVNYYRYRMPLEEYRKWEPDTPYLYVARSHIYMEQQLLDVQDRQFGIRSFHMDETATPKGTLYLNNQPIILRGANEMGHLQLCVMRNDYEQLIDDILIAKLCNMNYIRLTQRPVQPEIYEYLDRLGMMNQTDLPLFGFLRRNQFAEAVRQAAEMERLVRSYPSTIMVSFINEPTAADKPSKRRFKSHRHLERVELEAFFVAARQAIFIENPDRVVKNVEGDYEPPTKEGMPDFHTYTMWYTNHGVPIGELHKGHLPPFSAGWKAGCGEYGAEGLDNYEVMMKYYPPEWLPATVEADWLPDKIQAAQTHGMHGDWYEEQTNIYDWITASQQHQALATQWMTDAFRRRSDLVVMTALHLLIDAWPSGWMKAVVDVDRVPKPAYFAYQRSLEPVRIHLRSDRFTAYGGEKLPVEAWILNDRAVEWHKVTVRVTVRTEHKELASYEQRVEVIHAVRPDYISTVPVQLPIVEQRELIFVDASVVHEDGTLLNQERMTIEVFPRIEQAAPSSLRTERSIMYLGEQAALLCRELALDAVAYNEQTNIASAGTIVVSDSERFAAYEQALQAYATAGGRIILLSDQLGKLSYTVAGEPIGVGKLGRVQFVAIDRSRPAFQQFATNDLSYLYNGANDQIDYIANTYVNLEQIEPLVFGYAKNWSFQSGLGNKRKLPVIGKQTCGAGEIVYSTIAYEGRIGYNPALDQLLHTVITTNQL
ncbi:sugar-binding domain-containing protein [Paenibacillus yanchengensis]|uniref:Sugar-binding domain-containing protein n=1 Tax=Paenibacillus yanchengensis TaxID=2035833 RepID=A0ABW4YPH1_9BACL